MAVTTPVGSNSNSGEDKIEQIDLISLQKRDPEIKRLVTKGEYQGWKIWQHDTGLVLLTKMGENVPIWIVPTEIRSEMITLEHNNGHLGIEKTLKRMQTAG